MSSLNSGIIASILPIPRHQMYVGYKLCQYNCILMALSMSIMGIINNYDTTVHRMFKLSLVTIIIAQCMGRQMKVYMYIYNWTAVFTVVLDVVRVILISP